MSIINEASYKELLSNPNVKSLTRKHIVYSSKFKHHAILSVENGQSASSIWDEAGFQLSDFRSNYFGKCVSRWKSQLKNGEFVDNRGGCKLDIFLTRDEEIGFLRAENTILKEFRALGVKGEIKSTGLSLELYRQIKDSHLLDSASWQELANQAITSGWLELLESSMR